MLLLIGVNCYVTICVSFLDTTIIKPIFPKTDDGVIKVDSELIRGGDSYKYILTVKLDISEYNLHKHNLSEYVKIKAKDHELYKERIQWCVKEYGKGREYNVYTSFDDHDLNLRDYVYKDGKGNIILRNYYG